MCLLDSLPVPVRGILTIPPWEWDTELNSSGGDPEFQWPGRVSPSPLQIPPCLQYLAYISGACVTQIKTNFYLFSVGAVLSNASVWPGSLTLSMCN